MLINKNAKRCFATANANFQFPHRRAWRPRHAAFIGAPGVDAPYDVVLKRAAGVLTTLFHETFFTFI